MVQTIGSAGESLAAGAIFTLPALFVWSQNGAGIAQPDYYNYSVSLWRNPGHLVYDTLRKALIVRNMKPCPTLKAQPVPRFCGRRGRRRKGQNDFSGPSNRCSL